MKGFDDFQRKKHELNTMLQEIRVVRATVCARAEQARTELVSFARCLTHALFSFPPHPLPQDVDRLNEMRKKIGDDGRDSLTIRLSSDNNDRLRTATELFTELKHIQEKDEKKKKKKMSEKEIADRRELVILIGKEIVNLTNENARNKRIETDDEAAMRTRVEQRKRENEEKTRARRERLKKNRKGRKGKDGDIDEDDFKDVGPRSEQEQAFEQQVQQNMDEQNKILDEISKGLDDLKDLANEANKQLTVQGAMLEQVDQQMEATIGKFKAANKRLKDILESSGGMERWCPMIICVIILLALIGYLVGAI